jgi:hypothetical protein
MKEKLSVSSVTSDIGGLSKRTSDWFKPISEELNQGVEIGREVSTDYELSFTANDLYVFVGTFRTCPRFRAGSRPIQTVQ